MKKKYFILFLLLIGVAIWCWLHRSPTTQTTINLENSTTNELSASTKTEDVQEPLSATNIVSPLATESSMTLEDRKKQRDQLREQGLNEWRAPINFYGKIVDENDQPVEGAQISFLWNDLSSEGSSRASTTSDSAGLFSLLNKTGKGMSLKIIKEGYYTSTRDNKSFEYGDRFERFVPNANAPIIFHLRKHGKAEPLIAIDYPGFAKIAQLRRNGEPVEVDLINGKKASAGQGQLKLEFWSDPIDRKTTLFNWKFRISVPNGRIMETHDEFNFEAPEKGYSDFLEIEGSPEKWRSEVRNKYFIQLSDGKYGRIEFHLIAHNGVFDIQSFINPSGSRNLEYDEAVQFK